MRLKREEIWIVTGVPVLFLIGAIFHYLYKLCGESVIVGALAPVNESVWEHNKMIVLPIILWWSIYYIVFHKSRQIPKKKWFTAAMVSLISGLLLIPMIFYFYTGAFHIELTVIDILILFVALVVGHLLGLHIYRHADGVPMWVCMVVFIGVMGIFIVCTFLTPHIAMFWDTAHGGYGIH